VLADGAPAQVLTRARPALIAAGVWVPGYVPRVGARRPAPRRAPVLLSTHDLAVSRERSRRRRPARVVAAGIEAQLRAGEALSVTGPNGAGKSTVALTLAGLLPAQAGSVRAGDALRAHGLGSGAVGADPYGWSPAGLITRIGTVFQEPEHQFVTSTVYDELAFGPRRVAAAAAVRRRRARTDLTAGSTARIQELLTRLRLEHLAGVNPFTLSGGEKRRLSVATVLATSPGVLVLDEPTFGQDANTWAELAALLVEQLDVGNAVVAVTHDADFTAALGADRLHLGEGEPVRTAPPAGLT
jgi:energy-coupling factor transporter ATP-binding protein EcfA2